MGYLRFFALLAVVGMACDSRAQGTKEVWLDELDLSFCIQDWGLPQADRSVLDTPLTVAASFTAAAWEPIRSAVCCSGSAAMPSP